MKLRILRKPSLTSHPDIFWYHSQVRRFGIWIDCRDDPFMMYKYSAEMMAQSWDTSLERVEKFVDFVIHKQEMYPKSNNKVVAEYEA
jgi:hypothetical protein